MQSTVWLTLVTGHSGQINDDWFFSENKEAKILTTAGRTWISCAQLIFFFYITCLCKITVTWKRGPSWKFAHTHTHTRSDTCTHMCSSLHNSWYMFILFTLTGCCFVTFYTRKAALDAQNALHNIKTLPMVCKKFIIGNFFTPIFLLCFQHSRSSFPVCKCWQISCA